MMGQIILLNVRYEIGINLWLTLVFCVVTFCVLIKDFILESSIKFRDYAKTCLLLPDVRRIPSADIILQEIMTNKL